jgi:SH3-like domain-containing protein
MKRLNLLFLLVFVSLGCASTATLPKVDSTPVAQIVEHKPSAVPTPIRSARVTARVLNIREGATEHSASTGKYLCFGKSVIILECKNGWVRIDKKQWVNSKFLSTECPK